jgi:hypothetical protein
VRPKRAVFEREACRPQSSVEPALERHKRLQVTREVNPEHARRPLRSEVACLTKPERSTPTCGCRGCPNAFEHLEAFWWLLTQESQRYVQQRGVDPAVLTLVVRGFEAAQNRLHFVRQLKREEEAHASLRT